MTDQPVVRDNLLCHCQRAEGRAKQSKRPLTEIATPLGLLCPGQRPGVAARGERRPSTAWRWRWRERRDPVAAFRHASKARRFSQW